MKERKRNKEETEKLKIPPIYIENINTWRGRNWNTKLNCPRITRTEYVYKRSYYDHNPYKINAYGGYFGEGPYTDKDYPKIYSTWYKMLFRILEFNTRGNHSYQKVDICNEWYCYNVFAIWMDSYLGQLSAPKFGLDYEIDKDIKQWNFDHKIYSPETCVYLPKEINQALSGIHRERNVGKGLPVGVHKNSENSYNINISLGGMRPPCKIFKTPMEAFKYYRELKLGYLRCLANMYYGTGQITKEVYDLLYNIDIKPYPDEEEDN